MEIEKNDSNLSNIIIENKNIDIKQMDQQQINEIDNFNGYEEEFKNLNEKLEEPFNHETIYRDKDKTIKEYVGEVKNNKYDGKGILYDSYYYSYDEDKKIIFKGYFRQRKK